MPVRLRFTIALALLGFILFGLYGVFAYRGEYSDLKASTRREIRILGRSLQTSLANALRDEQALDVQETLAALEVLVPDIDIDVHDATGRAIARSPGALEDSRVHELTELATKRNAEVVEPDLLEDPDRLIYAAPLTSDDGALLGSLAVVRPLDDLYDDLRRTRERLLVGLGVFVVLTSIAGVALGQRYISRPLARVVDGLHGVREGDYATRVPIARDDEIGKVVEELNAMATELERARLGLEREQDARLRVERGLLQVDKLVTIGQLSAGLAHEIGSPLQVLVGRARSLLASSEEPETKRQAAILVEQAARISRIVEQLLSFARRRAPVIARCDLAAPVRKVLDLLEGESRRRGVTIRLDSDDRAHFVDGDVDQLQQVVLNLVRNALSVVEHGGAVTVRIERTSGPAEMDRVQLVVEDNGPGIQPDIAQQLFEPFFTTRAREGGTGLGLAVVRSIAMDHGGEVRVSSERGRGATFTVSLPPSREGRDA